MEHGSEIPILPFQSPGNFVENGHNLVARPPFHDNHDVVSRAEFLDVIEPELVEVALGVDQIEPARVEIQADGRQTDRENRQNHRASRNGHRKTQGQDGQTAQRGAQER